MYEFLRFSLLTCPVILQEAAFSLIYSKGVLHIQEHSISGLLSEINSNLKDVSALETKMSHC